MKERPMGMWTRFARKNKHVTVAGRPAFATEVARMEHEPLTAEQVADLKAAWAELAEAAKESPATGFHACSRGAKPWQDDPAAVRTVAALLRRVDADDAATESPTAQ